VVTFVEKDGNIRRSRSSATPADAQEEGRKQQEVSKAHFFQWTSRQGMYKLEKRMDLDGS